MLFETRKHRRRRELREAGFPPAWRALLAQRLAHWTVLDDAERARLEQLTLDLLAEKTWEAANEFELTEEMMLLIAAEASLLGLGLADDCYRGVHTILVHPSTVVLRGEHSQVTGVVSDSPMPVLGRAQHHGPIMIAWDAAKDEARHPERGHNVVFHEFAHALDMLDGAVDGTPPLDDREQLDGWIAVCTEAYERSERGDSEVLRPYAGVNPAEFFAVTTETFFTVPRELARHEPDLYAVLSGFYRQDPATRQER